MLIIKKLFVTSILAIPLVLTSILIYFLGTISNLSPYIFYPSILGVPIFSYLLIVRPVLNSQYIQKIICQLDSWRFLRQQEFKLKNEKEVNELKVDTSKYQNIKKKYTQLNHNRGLIIVNILIVLFSINYINQDFFEYIKDLSIFLLFLLPLIYNYFGRWIVISSEGIKSVSLFKKQLIKWDEVKSVGVSVLAEGQKAPDFLMLVYISKKEFKCKNVVIGRDKKGVVTFKFRAKMIHHLLTYWNGEVDNLVNVKRWRRYLIRNGIFKPDDGLDD